MAVTIRAPFPAGTAGTTAAATTTITTSVTLTTGDDLVASCTWDGSPDTGVTLSAKLDPTGANLSPDGSSVIVHSNANTVGFEQVFWWLNASLSAAGLLTGAAKNLTTTASAGANAMVQKAYAITGSSHSAPTVVTASGNSTTASVTTGTVATGDLAIGYFVGGTAYSSTNNTNLLLQAGVTGQAGWTAAGNSAAGAGSAITLTGTMGGADFWGAISTVWVAGGAVAADPSPNPIWTPGWREATTSANTVAPISQFLWLPQDIGAPPPIGSSLAASAAITAAGTVATATGASLTVTATLNAGSPMTIVTSSSDGQYFIDQNGNPRLYVGEDNWSMVADGGAPGTYTTVWNAYFTNRQAQGYTAVEVAWCSYPNPSVATTFQTGQDWDGTWPFGASHMDPTGTADSTFWGRRDQFFSIAASYGFTVVVNITTPSLGLTPAPAQKTWTTAQWQAFGTFLGNRYKNQPNIMWIFGDDYFGDIDSNLSACLTNIRAAGDSHLASIQNYQEATSRQDISTLTKDPLAFDVHAQFEWGYSYNPSYDVVEKAQNYTVTASDDVQHVVPPLWADGFYLASGTSAGQTDTRLERQMIWWALSSGACGFSTGDNEIWVGGSTWPNPVTSKSFYTSVMPAITTAFKNLTGWHLLAPDTSSVLVTAGRGTHVTPITSGGSGTPYIGNTDNYVTASRTPDSGSGSDLAVIYCGLAFSITIDQTKMRSGYTVTWIDPVSGATFAGTPGSTYNSATARGNNSAGDPDWVLVLQAPTAASTGAALAVTSTVTAAGAVSGGASLTVTADRTAGGNAAAGATLTVTANSTTAGNSSSGATLAVTATTTAVGAVAGSASLAVTAAINASAGGLAGDAALAVSSAIAAAGIVAVSTGASLTVTATPSAGSSTTGIPALAVTATAVAAGNVATGSGATLAVTAAVVAGSTPQSSSGLAVNAAVSASGAAGKSSDSALTVTAASTAAGVASYQGQAALVVTATEASAGVANYQATVTQVITVTIPATGSTVFAKGAVASIAAVIAAAGVVVTKVSGTASAASMTVPTANPATMSVPKATGG